MPHVVLPVGAFEVNCVLLWGEEATAWVVDPGGNAAAIAAELRRRHLTPALVVLTHGHIDHIAALDELLAAGPLPVHMHLADARWAFTPFNRLPPYLRVPARPPTLAGTGDGAVLSAGGLTARVLHTPGHSPGSICLHFAADNLLLSGDTLFRGSAGRTDLPGGDGAALARSLKRLAGLPEETRVIPGHGPATTIGAEKRANPFLAGVPG
jgi:hydroxyacylglutathione hydrolase